MTLGNRRSGFGTIGNRRSRPRTVGVGSGVPVTVGVGDIVRRERTIGNGSVTPIRCRWPRTVGNRHRGLRTVGDGWVRSALGGDRAGGSNGSVTSVGWD